MNSDKLFRLSPSDFKYLWEECKHCYYRKVISGIRQPSIGIPSIFIKMSSILQNSLDGTNLHDLCSELPSGKFVLKEGYLKSSPIPKSDLSYILGRFDLLIRFDDGTNGVIDVKVTEVKDEDLEKFDRQLHAYKFALENPADENYRRVDKVSKLGLLIVSPESINIDQDKLLYSAKPVFKKIEIDMPKFFDFIHKVEKVLTGPIPPPSSTCDWCKFRMGIH